MQRCTNCKHINPAGELFCLTCGAGELEPVGDELPFNYQNPTNTA